MTKIDLVIPVYNRRETTLKGLRSLFKADTAGMDVRVIVVDDASPDGTADAVAREFPQVELVHGTGDLHYAAGTNRGIERALERSPDFIATMNDDAVFHPQFLQRMIKTARENPKSIVGALLLLWDEPHRVFQVGQRWKTSSGGWVIPDNLTAFSVPQQPFEVECIVGNCVLFPREAIEQNGLMDEQKFPHGWGDAQYLMRMRKAGWRLLVDPKAYVWCEPNTYPAPLHTKGIKHAVRVLFKDERHPLNLKRQFVARWESAPTHAQAAASFAVYCSQLAANAVTKAVSRRKAS
jgi:GT2 family glycosyltransferase